MRPNKFAGFMGPDKGVGPKSKVFDVTPPGAAAPSSTARPVIVARGPAVSDPMVTLPGNPPTSTGEPLLKSQTPPVASTAPTVPEPAATVADSPAAAEKMPGPPGTIARPAVEPSSAADPDPTPKPAALPAESVTLPNEPVQSAQPSATEPAAADFTVSDEPTLPVEDDYFVHIATPKRRRMRGFVVVLIVLVLALGVADVLLDAGVLTVSGVPHTHFIQR